VPLPTIVQRGWSRHRRVISAIEESDLYLYLLVTRFAQLSQKRAFPLGTSEKLSRDARRQTSKRSASVAAASAAAGSGATDVDKVGAVDWVSSLLSRLLYKIISIKYI